ncbi:3-deoxy-manno-octulosonate cytidylyltransferase [Ningiella sp. W23]|uniref:3-deoxy-manno-octulosonate cytidylyltransferase n=1 Tax=Ningiella sp. W23 TaxID=3023715 RepID=UPI003758037A
MRYAIVIPARYESSRFPGKPLANICGKPMIQRVWERCCDALTSDKIYVATDSSSIQDVVEGFGGQVLMTSSNCLTGTDRLAEANELLDCDFLINVQGDEPLVSAQDISSVVDAFHEFPNAVINAMAPIVTEADFRSSSVPKVVTSADGTLLYMSRAGIPTDKSLSFQSAHRQVCIYAFSREHLQLFASAKEKTPLERIEDIEILRFLEHGVTVKVLTVKGNSIAVDYPEDISRVEKILLETIA